MTEYPPDVEEYIEYVKEVMDEAYAKLRAWKPKKGK